MDLPSPTELKELVSILAPGLIILGVRQRFVAGWVPELGERLLAYATVSAIYYAAMNPVATLLIKYVRIHTLVVEALEYVVVPAIIGIVFAVSEKFDWGTKIGLKFGIKPLHPIPTAWDYAMRHIHGAYVIVTTAAGTKIAGIYGEGAFASTSPGERDIFLVDIYDIVDGEWKTPTDLRSQLICGGDIRSIEIFREVPDERK